MKGGYYIVDLSHLKFKDVTYEGAYIYGDYTDTIRVIKECNKPIMFIPPDYEENEFIGYQGQAYPSSPMFSRWYRSGVGVEFNFHDDTDTTHDNYISIAIFPTYIQLSFNPII